MSGNLDTIRGYAPIGLAALFAAGGIIHFVRPETFTGIVPGFLPAPRAVVYLSGAAELLCAAGLLRREKWAAFASAALLVAVLPANIQMALDLTAREGEWSWKAIVAWARVPLQLPLIWAAVQARRETPLP